VLKKVLATLVMAAAMVGIAAVPAHAAFSACPTNRFCIFNGFDGTGGMYYWGPEFGLSCVNIGDPWNDVASSGKNNYSTSNWRVTVFQHAGCYGGVVSDYGFFQGYLAQGQSMNFNSLNNQASSFLIYTP
jgi:hypothetical protein